jgi:probable F420-dependent oxidoreductase
VTVRPFRFGVGPGGLGFDTAAGWRELARRLEGDGYSTLGVGDHLVGGYGPIAALTAAADATTTLRVAATTFGNDYRHPVVLAQETATIDVLSDGRLEVGIGAGWMRADYERAGMVMDRPGVRIERLTEAIAVLKGCWADAPCTFSGAHYRVDALDARPKPAQRPHPPILVGGAGPKVLTVGARHADIVGLNVDLRAGRIGPEMGASATAAATREKVALVRAESRDRATTPELQVYVHATAIGGDLDAARARAREALALTDDELAASPHVLIGEADAVADTLRSRREEYGISYISVDASAAEALAPVVARLAGT